jgi:porphobilinogen synthase
MNFPEYRARRMRKSELLRRLIRETRISVDNLIYPLFVRPGKGEKRPVEAMPGCFQMSTDVLLEEVERAASLRIPAILLFGIPEKKDAVGSDAMSESGIIATALRAIKDQQPEILVITDVCFCEYTDHGHCGVLRDGDVDNDATLENLAKQAVTHARAGADVVAPSDMMDGRVAYIREALDETGFADVAILSYAAKYASGFYGPFREAAESAPQSGDRRSYQMDPPNAEEAIRECALDIAEGADMIMVKPALAYLDVVYRVKQEFGYPTAAYCVSGEFSMIEAAAERGWLDRKRIVLEVLTGIRRAGADMILTYWAPEVSRWLAEG